MKIPWNQSGYLLFILLACLLGGTVAGRATSSRIDITTLGAVVNNAAYAAANTAAIQNAISRNPGCEAYLPVGTWYINKPIYLDQVGSSLAGAGQNLSILKAAPGYKGMTLVYQAWYPQVPNNENTTSDRPVSTFDGSVTGTRYGLRTYTEYPDLGTYHYGSIGRGDWADATSYAAGDQVVRWGLPYVCIQAHTSSQALNEPNAGTQWTSYWVRRKLCAAQFYATPFAGGAIVNAATGQVSRWRDMDNWSLDVICKNNMPGDFSGLLLSGPTTVNKAPLFQVTAYGGAVSYRVNLDNNTTAYVNTTQRINSGSTYRLTLQMKTFVDGTRMLALWGTEMGSGIVKLAGTYTFPTGCKLAPVEWGAVEFGHAGRWADTYWDYFRAVSDATLMGMHLTNSARYDLPQTPVVGSTQAVGGNTTITDQYRCFDNAADTVAFLPCTDNPQDSVPHTESDLYRYGSLITVQHGAASGDATQSGYGQWRNFVQLGGISNQEIHDLTIQNADTTELYPWGIGVSIGYLLTGNFYNLTIRGGSYAFSTQNVSVNVYYGFIDNCTLQGTEAAYFGIFEQFSGSNITIPTPGRTAILAVDGVPLFSNVTIGDGVWSGPYTNHLVRSTYTAPYMGGEQYLEGFTCNNPGMSYPRLSAFYLGAYGDTFVLEDSTVNTLPSTAAFLEIPNSGAHNAIDVLVRNCSVTQASGGSTFADFVRCSDPNVYARVFDCASTIPVQNWVNATNGSASNNVVTHHTDLSAPPTTRTWVQEGHVLTVPNPVVGDFTELRCVGSGTGTAASWVGIKPLGGTATNQPPTVSISSPIEGKTFNLPAIVTITATAADSDGGIAKVEFYQGTTKIGVAFTSPYSCTWSIPLNVDYTLTARAYDTGYSLTTSAPIHIHTALLPPTVSFVTTDTGTQGNWKGVYGQDGYNVFEDSASYPAYVNLLPSAHSTWTWDGTPSDVRALQRGFSGRIAACWYNPNSLELTIGDGQLHRVAIYLVDRDGTTRDVTVQITDASTLAVLDTQRVTGFHDGKYLVWNISGHVIISLTNNGAGNCTWSGIFFS